MSETLKALEKLVSVAIGAHGDKRKDLFAAASGLYLENAGRFSDQERDLFGEVIGIVLFDVDAMARQALAEELAIHETGPHGLARRLLNDEPSVALPLLEKCIWLGDDELSGGLSDRSEAEAKAIARRPDLNRNVLTSLIQLGSVEASTALLGNASLVLSADDIGLIVGTLSETDEGLTRLIADRTLLPERLAEMFFHTTHGHKVEILAALGVDQDAARGQSSKAGVSKTTVERDLIDLLRSENRHDFETKFAAATGVNAELATRILEDATTEALAVACKSQDFQRATFSTFALLVKSSQQRSPMQINRLMSLYQGLNVPTAARVMNLWNAGLGAANEPAINAA